MDYRLRDIREDHDLKQKDIAKILKIQGSSYSDIETERLNIRLQDLLTICNQLGYSMDYVCRLSIRNHSSSLLVLDKIDKMVMAERLTIIEREQDICPKEIADELGITPSSYYRYKSSKISYLMQTLMVKRLAKKYHYSIDWIVGRSDTKYSYMEKKNNYRKSGDM